jgi:hypothetical protein
MNSQRLKDAQRDLGEQRGEAAQCNVVFAALILAVL